MIKSNKASGISVQIQFQGFEPDSGHVTHATDGITGFPGARRWLLAAAAAVLLGGCATAGDSRDPIEPFNRAMFSFNEGLDKAVVKPVAEGYRAVVPGVARSGVTNFFGNLEDLWIAVNQFLQGKFTEGVQDIARFIFNSTIGMFGLIDVASDFDLPKHNEDFGQTLGRWGVGNGAYVVLPFIGPRTTRDAVATVVDIEADIVRNVDHVPTRNTLLVTRLINTRADFLDTVRAMEDAALDKYIFVRDSYLQRRRNLIYDGNPPREPAADFGSDPVAENQAPSSEANPDPVDASKAPASAEAAPPDPALAGGG